MRILSSWVPAFSGLLSPSRSRKRHRSVILLERSLKEPNRIVGELLQPGGVGALEKLGLRHCLDGIDSMALNPFQSRATTSDVEGGGFTSGLGG